MGVVLIFTQQAEEVHEMQTTSENETQNVKALQAICNGIFNNISWVSFSPLNSQIHNGLLKMFMLKCYKLTHLCVYATRYKTRDNTSLII